MKPPAFPIMSKDYDPDQLNRFMRTLTQYLTQEATDQEHIAQRSGADEVMDWLGGW